MADRRSLIEGMKKTPSAMPVGIEREFVYGAEENGPATQEPLIAVPAAHSVREPRAPISTRIRADYADALKRASLERQLAKVEPNTISDILERALEPWLKSNGYLV